MIRTLVGFYDISYSDGLAVCGAVAREMLSYGEPRNDSPALWAGVRLAPILSCTVRVATSLHLDSLVTSRTGSVPAYTMMPAVDVSFPLSTARTQPFLVGRLDSNAANGGGRRV